MTCTGAGAIGLVRSVSYFKGEPDRIYQHIRCELVGWGNPKEISNDP